MKPIVELDTALLAANARTWKSLTNAQLFAVVKAEGYGWGLGTVVPALEGIADAFCVADAEEFFALRAHTQQPAIILGSVADGELDAVLRGGAQPALTGIEQLRIAERTFAALGKPFDARIGVRPAAAWSGFDLDELRELAPHLAHMRARVQLWTHITGSEQAAGQLDRFQAARTLLEEAGALLAGTDVCATASAAAGVRVGTAVRIGAGLFGSGASGAPGVRCALRVQAPIVRIEHFPAGTPVGYGGTMLRMDESIATARCGYSDGLPNTPGFADDILSVGMQYLTVRAGSAPLSHLVVLDATTDLDGFAARSGRLPHEIVAAFGNTARARNAV